MKVGAHTSRRRTTVILSEDLLQEIDELSKEYKSRSQFIETVLRGFIRKRQREERDARDLAIINQNADRLNAEVADLLDFVADL